MSEHTFVVEKNCPICGKTTRVVKTKSRLMVIKTDEDFCNHYSDGFNPYFYNIWVCEHCGFAADEKHFLGSFMEDRFSAIFVVQNCARRGRSVVAF